MRAIPTPAKVKDMAQYRLELRRPHHAEILQRKIGATVTPTEVDDVFEIDADVEPGRYGPVYVVEAL